MIVATTITVGLGVLAWRLYKRWRLRRVTDALSGPGSRARGFTVLENKEGDEEEGGGIGGGDDDKSGRKSLLPGKRGAIRLKDRDSDDDEEEVIPLTGVEE